MTVRSAPSATLLVELALPDGYRHGEPVLGRRQHRGESKSGNARGPDCGITSSTTLQSVAARHGQGEADVA